MKKIKVAIAGVGNCATSLIQGIEFYLDNPEIQDGLTKQDIGGYTPADIEFVAAFDVDKRKVGKPLNEAIYEKPNCAIEIVSEVKKTGKDVIVQSAPVLDGVSNHMLEHANKDQTFVLTEERYCDVVQVLKDTKADILINYLPVGSDTATAFYADAAIQSNVAFLNCIPVFIASNPYWAKKFVDAGLPLIGDDMKSQFGASIVSQMLQELAFARGHKVKCHIQENVGGNTDFLNMKNQDRLKSKKISKENVIRSQNIIRNIPEDDSFLYAGPSNYIPFYGDNKIANFHLELEGFGGSPVILDARLSVQDSPNSAGIVIDAIRYLKVAREMRIVGPLHGASAFTQKSPPFQMKFEDAEKECVALANRKLTNLTKQQIKILKNETSKEIV